MAGAFKLYELKRSARNLALIAAVMALASPMTAAPAIADGDHPPVAQLRQSGEDITRDLVDLHGRFKRAVGAERARLQAELRGVAIARHDLLAGLIKDHPEEVLRLALPDQVAAAIPADAQAW
ncbi:MAG: hypothetical protein ACREEE_07925, partial [Dongiaceae bacterium]